MPIASVPEEFPTPVDPLTMLYNFANKEGDIGLLQWMKEHNFEFDSSHFNLATHLIAAEGGSVAVFEWLNENGICDWNEWTCATAAGANHLELLK